MPSRSKAIREIEENALRYGPPFLDFKTKKFAYLDDVGTQAKPPTQAGIFKAIDQGVLVVDRAKSNSKRVVYRVTEDWERA